MCICLGTLENGHGTMKSVFSDVTSGGIAGVGYCEK